LKLVMRPRREQVMFCSKYVLKFRSIDDARENPGSPHDCRVGPSCRRSPRHHELPVSGVTLSLRSPCSATDERLQLAGNSGSSCSPKADGGNPGIGERRSVQGHDPAHLRLIDDFHAWQAAWLLVLPGLEPEIRRRLERCGRQQAMVVHGQHRLYPEIIDREAISEPRWSRRSCGGPETLLQVRRTARPRSTSSWIRVRRPKAFVQDIKKGA